MHTIHVALTLALQLLPTLVPTANAAALSPPTATNSTAPSQLQPPSTNQSFANYQPHKPESTHIPLPLGANLTLTITYLGAPIPSETTDEHLYYGTETIRRFLSTHANDPIRHNRWSYGDLSDIQIIVAGNTDSTVTYAQLFAVLGGLRDFMLRPSAQESRNLQFDLSVEGKGKVGFGLVWRNPSTTAAGNVFPNATSLQPPTANASLVNATLPLVAASERQWVPIPGTSIMLVFDFFGDPIPPTEYEKAFAASNLEIIDHIGRRSNWPIPHGRFEYDDSDAHIVVIADRGIDVTWLELFQILQGLHGFVTGHPPRYQILHYEIYQGLDIVGFGLLWYDTPRGEGSAATS